MALFALAGLGGAAVGLARGGRPSRLLALRLWAVPLAWACLAAQLVLGLAADGPPEVARDGVLLASYAGIGVWLAVNACTHRGGVAAGFVALLAGWLLNVAPMVLNDGMPVSTAALRSVGHAGAQVEEGQLWKHVPATSETEAAWLGDVIPVPPVGAVISAGDVLFLAGIGAVVASALRSAD